jgi:pimeloyl-ACP methyl ester carboxylesterase
MKTYAISGLGTDYSIFSEIVLYFELTILPWIKPEPKESFHEYALRFSERFNENEPFNLIGVSFGGMLAQEINQIKKAEKVILVSSAISRTEIPLLFRIGLVLGIHKVLSGDTQPPEFLISHYFGLKQQKHREMLKSIMNDMDPDFLKWALSKISTWNSPQPSENLYRIHGTSDKILYCFSNHNTQLVKDSGHFVSVERADEVSKLLNKMIQTS